MTRSRKQVYRNRLSTWLMQYVVTVSPSLGRRYFEYNSLPLDKMRVVTYGADVGAVQRVAVEDATAVRARCGFGAEHLVIGSVGRLVEQKDYPTQLRGFARAAAQVPVLRMVLAGDGPLRPSLEALARELNLGERVCFLGHCDNVPAVMRGLDIFVLASKFEPFGVALLEAKAAGLAIVATAVNEIPEIVSDGETALLVPPHSPEQLAEAFVRLAQDTHFRHDLGLRARAEASTRHSLEAAVESYQAIYDACY
jgi:glycosyltransferase involved in cell wall biosynthesis